jgi:PST family polysaccharide transporter
MIKGAVKMFREFVGHGLMQNVLALLSVQFFRKILPLLTIPYLARVLGPGSWGLVAIFQSLAMCTVLVIEFGFQLSATRQIARSRNSGESVAGVFAGVLGAQMVLAVCAVSGILLFSSWVPVLKEHPAMLASCLLWAVAEGINPIWYFLGMERMKIVATLEICSKTAAAVAMFALVHSPEDTGIVMALQAIAPLLSIVAALWIVYRDIPFQLPSVALVRDALVTGWPMFVMRSAESLYTLANAFVLGMFAGPTVVGYFAGPEKISRALVGVFNPVRETLYPRISKLVHTSPAQASRLARIGMIVTGSGGLLMGVFVFCSAPFLVKIVLGAQFGPAVGVLRMLAILPPLISVTQSVGMQWLLPLGKEHAVTRILVMAGMINLVLAFVLVPKHAHIGMAWAVICAEAFVSVCMIYLAVTDRDHRMPLRRQASIEDADFAAEYEAIESGSPGAL